MPELDAGIWSRGGGGGGGELLQEVSQTGVGCEEAVAHENNSDFPFTLPLGDSEPFQFSS